MREARLKRVSIAWFHLHDIQKRQKIGTVISGCQAQKKWGENCQEKGRREIWRLLETISRLWYSNRTVHVCQFIKLYTQKGEMECMYKLQLNTSDLKSQTKAKKPSFRKDKTWSSFRNEPAHFNHHLELLSELEDAKSQKSFWLAEFGSQAHA